MKLERNTADLYKVSLCVYGDETRSRTGFCVN